MTDSEHWNLGQSALLRDLRAVALHEYAHLHVAQHFGIWGWVCIRPSSRPGTGPFAGQFTAETIDDAHAQRIIGLAGACAERLDCDPGMTPAVGSLRLSPTDAAMAGEFDMTDVEECLAILRASWPAIVRDAHGAIELELRDAQRATALSRPLAAVSIAAR